MNSLIYLITTLHLFRTCVSDRCCSSTQANGRTEHPKFTKGGK